MRVPAHILPVIVLAQFCCTSLWFAGNGVMDDLVRNFSLESTALGHLTAAVQFGFIAGTLVFALLTLADRISPSRVFFGSALIGALFNLCMVLADNTLGSLLFFRFLTGFFLAGIYPVGMKIAADYYDRGLGPSLGWLVGALVVGTAFPHLLRAWSADLPWRSVIYFTSGIAAAGGLLMLVLVPDGPFRKPGTRPDLTAFFRVFRRRPLRAAAFGYFGHMWELYTFWAFVPVILATHNALHAEAALSVPAWSFAIIAGGGIACVLGGYLSLRFGAKRVAATALSLSGLCCLLSPWVFTTASSSILLVFLFFWGLVVIADSPLFSTLVARNAAAETKGTALTIVNSIGFAVTIISIQTANYLVEALPATNVFLFLAIGPAFGLWSLFTIDREDSHY